MAKPKDYVNFMPRKAIEKLVKNPKTPERFRKYWMDQLKKADRKKIDSLG